MPAVRVVSQHHEAVDAVPRKIVCRQRASGTQSSSPVVDVGVITTPSRAVLTRQWTPASNATFSSTPAKDERTNEEGPATPFPPRDFAWCPFMEDDEVQPCFLMTSKSAPVTLWDPTEGCARATYRAYNAMDEHISPYSLLWPSAGSSSSAAGSSSSTFYAGYGSMEDTVAHVRAYDAAVEGRTPSWFYKSRFIKDKTTIVSHLTEVTHATNPNLIGIGYTGGGSGHLVEILDTRHRKTATLLQPVNDQNKPMSGYNGTACIRISKHNPWRVYTAPRVSQSTVNDQNKPMSGYNGTACIRISKHNPWRVYTAPRVSQSTRTPQPVFVWDIRRSSAPVRTIVVDDAPEICGAFFDVAASSQGREVIIAATKSGGLVCYEATHAAAGFHDAAAAVTPLNAVADGVSPQGASVVSVVDSGDASLSNVVVAVGGGGRPISEAPLRDRWEENEGLGTSRSGLLRGRDGTQLTPFADGEGEECVRATEKKEPWLSLAVVALTPCAA
ncbi:Hypothetical protein, putative [Bodo saltans]|uniref:Uncharacterized protein n=1 Tax=Bodo saltans TaxID=75058 RepID=A0A0S4JJQ6_BODSA|nr:Hypothetical protein, putative [Bodo saltans]|eukprot:CUG91730.1 Hypothetical protein, putative [Bodo saltans]